MEGMIGTRVLTLENSSLD